MSNENKTKTTLETTTDVKPGVVARAQSWAASNPTKSTVITSAATFGAIKGIGWGVEKAKEHFGEKAAEPAKEQAASLVTSVARGFSKRW